MSRLIFSLIVAGFSAIVGGQSTLFKRTFAPQEGPTASVERAYRTELCLNGSWQFQPVADSLPAPKKDGWESKTIRIPSPWNVNAFPVESRDGGDFRTFPSYPKAWEKVQAGWLRRSFKVPASWRGRRLLLRFDAVAGDAQVLVNGQLVARHFDLFLPFEADVTDAVRFGEVNELQVGVRKASLTDVQGPNGRRTYQGGSMWGQAIAGIWQDVFLKAVPVARIDDVFVKPDVARNTLSAEVTLRNDTDKPRRMRVAADVRSWVNRAGKGTLDAPEPKSALGPSALKLQSPQESVVVPAHGTASVSLSAKVGDRLKTWVPGNPNLYSMICRVEGDTKATRFGWRQITFKGTSVLLNGKPLTLRGDSWHFMGVPQMTRRYAWAWFKTLQGAGLNAVRLHAQPYPAFYLDMADETGILVLDETAIWASDGGPKLDSEAFWTDSERHLRDLIRRDRNHPSVFGWSVSNEVTAVVRNVFHAPKAVEDRASQMNGIWAKICREEDPTRVWISADGEEDGQGQLPVSIIHYGDRGTMQEAIRKKKPWGVGEAGPAYYGSPKQIAEMAKDERAYLSFADRMEGVAKVSAESLRDQNELGGAYRSVFNLVWYGLKPLELGLSDTSRPPTLDDGIRFPAFVEGRPGMQPERLGPYCTTLNPGYDPKLPLYSPWPLFEAIKGAAQEPPVDYQSKSAPLDSGLAKVGTIPSVRVLSTGGSLAASLSNLGVSVKEDGTMLFVDGVNPPGPEAKAIVEEALVKGGTVVVWGARTETLSKLNLLLPRPLGLTERVASALVAVSDPLTGGLTPASLYFSEQNPFLVLKGGLAGPLLEGARTLLSASDTDWRRWNGQGETVKTAMVLRSEREAKPSGIALAEVTIGSGRLIVCNLSLDAQMAAMNRTILGNLGVVLGAGGFQGLLDADGRIRGALLARPLNRVSNPDSLEEVNGQPWRRVTANAEGRISATGDGAAYFSFWVYSPKALANLLLDPHLPKVGIAIRGGEAQRLWLNGKAVGVPLLLEQGWNRIVLRVENVPSEGLEIRLTSSLADYLKEMRVTDEKPQ